jgi:hypothetical protein
VPTTEQFTFKSQQLFVPSVLADLPAFLSSQNWTPREINDHQDKVAFVLNRIVTAPVYDYTYQTGDFINLNFDFMVSVLGARYVRKILALLVEAGVIECDHKKLYGSYGEKSFGYRVTEKYQSPAVGLLIFKQEIFGKKLWQLRQQTETTLKKDPFLNRIHKDMKQLRIRHAAAVKHNTTVFTKTEDFITQRLQALDTTSFSKKAYAALVEEGVEINATHIHLPQRKDVTRLVKKNAPDMTYYKAMKKSLLKSYSSNLIAIEKLHNRDYSIPVRPVPGSRVYTNLTNMSSGLRQFLYHKKFEDEILVNIDIKNSQPFFLNLLLAKKYKGKHLPNDVKLYMQLTSLGTFYEFAAMAMNEPMETKRERREFKAKFFGSVFFCENLHTKGSKFGQWFMDRFENVYALTSAIKAGNHKALAVVMQKEEAGLMLDTVMVELHKRKIWAASIHDSIVCRPGDQESVKEIILTAFQAKAGLVPSLDVEPVRK